MQISDLYIDPSGDDSFKESLALILTARMNGDEIVVYGTQNGGQFEAIRIFTKKK